MKQKKFYIKHLIIKLVSCIMVSFLVITASVMPKKENYIIHADTDVKINPFVWLCSYFGINIYTDAQEINEAFYTGIQDAYNVWLLTQQPQQRVSIDDIIGSISWDSQQPKMVKIAGWAFNAMRAFADYLDSKVTTASEALELGTFETEAPSSYYVPYNDPIQFTYDPSNRQWYSVKTLSDSTRILFYIYNSNIGFASVSLTSKTNDVQYYNPYVPGWQNWSTNNQEHTSNGIYFYTRWTTINNASNKSPDINVAITTSSINQTFVDNLYYYTFGSGSFSGEATLNDIYALPNQATLDDLIGAADPDSDVSIDIEDSDIPWSNAATLQDILDAINSLTDSYVLDDSYPDTLGKVIAQGIPIINEMPDVTYPNAPTWDVPEIIDTSVITPLLEPECPTLSACLVSGIQEVGNTMNDVIESNSNISNYVSVTMFLGLSLMILGAVL